MCVVVSFSYGKIVKFNSKEIVKKFKKTKVISYISKTHKYFNEIEIIKFSVCTCFFFFFLQTDNRATLIRIINGNNRLRTEPLSRKLFLRFRVALVIY